ncbi:unnamed protein product [Cercospora beticola]|nr:unnamed protein product [Cercospora beticola]
MYTAVNRIDSTLRVVRGGSRRAGRRSPTLDESRRMSSTAGAQPWRTHGVRIALRDHLNKVPSRSMQFVYLASRLVFIYAYRRTTPSSLLFQPHLTIVTPHHSTQTLQLRISTHGASKSQRALWCNGFVSVGCRPA